MHACTNPGLPVDSRFGTRYLVPIKISVKNKTVLIQRLALYPATATCIASAPVVPEPSSTFWDETYHSLPGSPVPPPQSLAIGRLSMLWTISR